LVEEREANLEDCYLVSFLCCGRRGDGLKGEYSKEIAYNDNKEAKNMSLARILVDQMVNIKSNGEV
jgi:hypothetical protein